MFAGISLLAGVYTGIDVDERLKERFQLESKLGCFGMLFHTAICVALGFIMLCIVAMILGVVAGLNDIPLSTI